MPKIMVVVSALALLALSAPAPAQAAQGPSCRAQCIKYCNRAPGGMASTQNAKSHCMSTCLGNCQSGASKKI